MNEDWERRFGGIARLYGRAALDRLRRAHVMVVGLGGVGSWAAEALARTGIGCLTLVDLDDVCPSNLNRQVHARQDTLGSPKVIAMAERLRAIHPELDVRPVRAFFTPATADDLLAPASDAVVDAIDDTANKCLLLARCRAAQRWVLTSGGAGGRRDPTRLRTADLALTSHDVLLQLVRRRLRQEYGFPGGAARFGIPCVFSTELPVFPHPDGTVRAHKPHGACGGRPGAQGDSGLGSAVFVSGSLGFLAAAETVRHLTGVGSTAP